MSLGLKRKKIVSLSKLILNNKQFLIVTTIILLIGVGYGAYRLISLNKKSDKSIIVKTPEQKVTEIIQESVVSNDTATAQIEFKKLADSEPDPTKKSVYLYASVDMYYNSGDYKNGVEVAKAVDNLVNTALSAGNVANGYMGVGDYLNAAKYYGIAADRSSKPANERMNSPYNDYIALKQKAEAQIK